jgi:hypothetical protein
MMLMRRRPNPEEAPDMTQPNNLWDFAELQETLDQQDEREERDTVRRRTIKKLRTSGHWLTLLRVARTIPQPFTLNDISVAVWKDCPEFFGMKGYPYPDNHKVHYILYGDRGLIAKGLLHRVRTGLFEVPHDLNLETLAASADE